MSRNIIYAVLAGGASSRFKKDKRFAQYNGKMLIEYPISVLKQFSDLIYVVVKPKENLSIDAVIINDDFLYGGPVCGIYTLLRNIDADFYVFLVADMPFVNKHMIQQLIQSIDTDHEAYLFKCGEKWNPFPLILGRGVLNYFNQNDCINESVHNFFKNLNIKYITCDEDMNFANINTQNDYEILT